MSDEPKRPTRARIDISTITKDQADRISVPSVRQAVSELVRRGPIIQGILHLDHKSHENHKEHQNVKVRSMDDGSEVESEASVTSYLDYLEKK